MGKLYTITKEAVLETRNNNKAVKDVTVFFKTREFEKIGNVTTLQRPAIQLDEVYKATKTLFQELFKDQFVRIIGIVLTITQPPDPESEPDILDVKQEETESP